MMKNCNYNVMRLKMQIDTTDADMDILKKYGKVKEGIIREILVPSDMNLHALHFVIQQAFGWRNYHLHRFFIHDDLFADLTSNRFEHWMRFCGLYFQFPGTDMADKDLDEAYDESMNIKTWLRKKYSPPYQYLGNIENYYEAQKVVRDYYIQNKEFFQRVSLDIRKEMSESEREGSCNSPRQTSSEGASGDDSYIYLEDSNILRNLLERLRCSEIFGERPSSDELAQMLTAAETRYNNSISRRISPYSYSKIMAEINGSVLPITNELMYEYDFGDEWYISITLIDEYHSTNTDIEGAGTNNKVIRNRKGEIVDGELYDQIDYVLTKHKPRCIAMDGLPVLENSYGIMCYCTTLQCMHTDKSKLEDTFGLSCSYYIEQAKIEAKELGWTGRMTSPARLL